MASFRDRFLTPGVAKAIMSPWRLLLGAAAGVVAALLGVGIGLAVVIGIAAYGATVLAAVPRRERAAPIDAFTLSEPWRRYVQGAQSARRRFDQVLTATQSGPIRERLASIGERLDDGVQQCWLIACRGDQLDAAVARIDPVAVRARLAALGKTGETDTGATIASLEAQLASADRMKATSAQAASRLSLMRSRLDELVARAAEVGVGAGDTVAFSSEVDSLVTELEGLRLALDEANRASNDPTLPRISFTERPDRPDEGTPGTETTPGS